MEIKASPFTMAAAGYTTATRQWHFITLFSSRHLATRTPS